MTQLEISDILGVYVNEWCVQRDIWGADVDQRQKCTISTTEAHGVTSHLYGAVLIGVIPCMES